MMIKEEEEMTNPRKNQKRKEVTLPMIAVLKENQEKGEILPIVVMTTGRNDRKNQKNIKVATVHQKDRAGKIERKIRSARKRDTKSLIILILQKEPETKPVNDPDLAVTRQGIVGGIDREVIHRDGECNSPNPMDL